MDLLASSFFADSTIDLTENELFELCHDVGIAKPLQPDEPFVTSITTKTKVDQVSGNLATYVITRTLPKFMQAVDPAKIEQGLIKVLCKNEPQAGWDVGLIGPQFSTEQAAILFQRALLIKLKDDVLFYSIQASQADAFRADYQARVNNKQITSIANTTEYINKYTHNVCINAYASMVTMNYRKQLQQRMDEASLSRFNEADYNKLWEKICLSMERRNPNFQQFKPAIGNRLVTVNSQAIYTAIKELEFELGLESDVEWLENYFINDRAAESMLDFAKRQQPMYYQLDDLLS